MTVVEIVKIQIMQSNGWEVTVVVPQETDEQVTFRAVKTDKNLMHFNLNTLFEQTLDDEETLKKLFNINTVKE